MTKLKLEVQVSVDGFIADQRGRTDWMVWNWGPRWNCDNALQQSPHRTPQFIGLHFAKAQMSDSCMTVNIESIL